MAAEEVPRSATLLSVEPPSIDFGRLKPGDGANATLRVSGGPGQVIVHSDRLKVTPISFSSKSTELHLTLLDGSVGELMWDDVLLRGGSSELKVLVTARWEEVIAHKPKLEPEPEPEAKAEPEAVPEPIPTKPLLGQKVKEIQQAKLEAGGNEIEGRTFKGNSCRWCGKNIRYDTDSQSWKPCKTCNGARIVVSVILRISREAYLGAIEVGLSLREIWEVLIGKERQKK